MKSIRAKKRKQAGERTRGSLKPLDQAVIQDYITWASRRHDSSSEY
ncbi:MAG: hypothetical protein ACFFD4_21620 [Candidatus Odinarchaeota archaeon]